LPDYGLATITICLVNPIICEVVKEDPNDQSDSRWLPYGDTLFSR